MSTKGDNARLRILECAHSLFSQKGYCGVTMQDICIASGFSRGGLYRHYASTEDIFIDIIKFEQQQAFGALENARERNLRPDVILRSFLQTRMNLLAKPAHSFDVAVSEFAANSDKGRQVLVKRAEDSVRILSGLIEEGNESGVFRCAAPTATAAHILWLMEGMSRHSSLLPITQEDIREQLCLIEALLKP